MGDVADCAAIELNIEGITGVSDADDDFIRSAQKFVVSSVPSSLLLWAITETVPGTHGGNNSNQQITLPVKSDSLIFVRRDQFEAQKVNGSMRGFIGNTNSLHKATNTFPKYYISDGNRVIVKPDPDNTYTAHAQYVDYSKINDDSDLRNAVIYHASSKEFEKLSSAKADISVSFTESPPTYIPPVMEDKTAFSSYTSGLSETDPGVFSIASVPPSTPSSPSFTTPAIGTITIASTTLSNIGTPPTYTSPSITSAAGGTDLLDIVAGVPDNDTDQIDFSKWWDILSDYIESEEDSELASSQIQKISTYLQAYSQEMQNKLNVFNDANVEYQTKLQEGIQQAQIDSQKAQAQAQIDSTEAQQETSLLLQKENQEYASSLQKFSAEVQEYQAEVNTQVQEYSQKLAQYQSELQISVQTWQQVESEKITRFQAGVQDAMNKFNNENIEYQAQLQVSIQNTQLKSTDATHYANESKKYYEWAVTEVNMYIQNNSKMINKTMAAQSTAQQQRR